MITAIIGAGIAGLTAAIALRKIGITTLIFEAAPQLMPVGAGLGLAANALQAFEHLGIADEVVAAGISLNAYHILDEQGQLINSTNSQMLTSRYGRNNFTIHRGALHQILLAQLPSGTVQLNKKAVDVNVTPAGITLFFADNTQTQADHLIVADGIYSPIRQKLFPAVQPRYAGYACWRAVIPNPGLHLAAAIETWGAQGRFGYVPLAGNLIYWYACINAPAHSPLLPDFTISNIRKIFNHYHAPIPELLAHTNTSQLILNDICDLPALPRYAVGNILFIGDAGHATTPNLGQGACQAIEDGVILAEVWRKSDSFAAAAASFEKRRRSRTQWIIKQSYRLGQVAQLQHPVLIRLRNQLFRWLPAAVNERQLHKMFQVDF